MTDISTDTATFEAVSTILQRNFKVPADVIDAERTLRDHDLDSLDIVELAEVFEQEFGIQINDDELSEAGTLGAVVELVARRRAS